MKYLQYFLFNALITGILIVSYLLGVSSFGAIIVGIYYGIVVTTLFLTVIAISIDKKYIAPLVPIYKNYPYWSLPFDWLFIAVAIYLGFPKIAVCMIFESVSVLYLMVRVNIYLKENKSGS